MSNCYIYDAVRTPRGKGKSAGALHTTPSLDLITTCLNALTERYDIEHLVEECILGCVMPTGEQGGNIARTAVLASSIGTQCSGLHVNRFCSSGLDAVNLASSHIKQRNYSLAIAGGVESMSRVPMMSDGGAMLADTRVAFKHHIVPQGISADLIATQNNYHRTQLDEWAVLSHTRAYAAQKSGIFDRTMIDVCDVNQQVILQHDECIRSNCQLSELSQLEPSFAMMAAMAGFDDIACQKYPDIEHIQHVHHAGNSSALADGACAILLGNDQKNIKPRARIIGYAQSAGDPTIMLTQPAIAANKVLSQCGLTCKDIDIWEINEAFSSVVLYAMDKLKLSQEQVNCHGGAIAMGHPLGATGAMLISHALDILEERQQKRALITLCTALGMGVATIIERL
ncbi:MAG: acetyl-CoA C-acetyltransferase [Candidatus Comchoanobacterales bacterium]